MQDTTRRDALERNIAGRLPACDEAELDALDRMMTAMEKRRDILEVQRQIEGSRSCAPEVDRRIERVTRANRGAEVTAALRELRDAQAYTPPRLTLINGGDEQP